MRAYIRRYLKIGTLTLIACLLTGCWNAAITGAQLVYDRHEIMKDVNNYIVKVRADDVLGRARKHRPDMRLAVSSFNHDLLLVGQVPTEQDKKDIGDKLLKVAGRRRVYNELEVKPPVSVTQSIKDSWITSKIIAGMLADSKINPEDFKVVTEDDVVYLLGDVRRDQSELVVNIARRTRGVKYVVRIFRYYTFQDKSKYAKAFN